MKRELAVPIIFLDQFMIIQVRNMYYLVWSWVQRPLVINSYGLERVHGLGSKFTQGRQWLYNLTFQQNMTNLVESCQIIPTLKHKYIYMYQYVHRSLSHPEVNNPYMDLVFFSLFFFSEGGDADWLGMMKTCETILLNMYNITLITRGA